MRPEANRVFYTVPLTTVYYSADTVYSILYCSYSFTDTVWWIYLEIFEILTHAIDWFSDGFMYIYLHNMLLDSMRETEYLVRLDLQLVRLDLQLVRFDLQFCNTAYMLHTATNVFSYCKYHCIQLLVRPPTEYCYVYCN